MSESSRDEFLKERDAPVQLGVAEALALAIHIHRLGEYEDAEKRIGGFLTLPPTTPMRRTSSAYCSTTVDAAKMRSS